MAKEYGSFCHLSDNNPSSAFTPVIKNKTTLGPTFLKTKNHKYNSRYSMLEKPRQKRAVIQEMVRPLKQWLIRHRHHPYPTKTEKVQLAIGSNMTIIQVSNWFANARRRLKNVVQGHRSSWSKRLRMYNQFVHGNAELLSISSNDSIWNSEDEDDSNKRETTNTSRDEEDSCGNLTATTSSRVDDDVVVYDDRDVIKSLPPTDSSKTSKYKTSMLHRYLSDSVQNNLTQSNPVPVRPVATKPKSSTPVLVTREEPVYPFSSTHGAYPQPPLLSSLHPMSSSFHRRPPYLTDHSSFIEHQGFPHFPVERHFYHWPPSMVQDKFPIGSSDAYSPFVL